MTIVFFCYHTKYGLVYQDQNVLFLAHLQLFVKLHLSYHAQDILTRAIY